MPKRLFDKLFGREGRELGQKTKDISVLEKYVSAKNGIFKRYMPSWLQMVHLGLYYDRSSLTLKNACQPQGFIMQEKLHIIIMELSF